MYVDINRWLKVYNWTVSSFSLATQKQDNETKLGIDVATCYGHLAVEFQSNSTIITKLKTDTCKPSINGMLITTLGIARKKARSSSNNFSLHKKNEVPLSFDSFESIPICFCICLTQAWNEFGWAWLWSF